MKTKKGCLVVEVRLTRHKKQSMSIPLDTLGHPLPPPVPSMTICKIPRKKWGQWWLQHASNTLPIEKECCVCGFSFEMWQLTALDTALVHANVQRQYLNGMMTKNLFACWACKRKCDRCSRPVPEAQKKLFSGLCQECCGEEKTPKTQKSKTQKTPAKRKAPPGR